MRQHLGFTLNEYEDEPWYDVESQLFENIINTLVKDTVDEEINISGHKHNSLYSGILYGDTTILGNINTSGSITNSGIIINSILDANSDVNKFLVIDTSGNIKYRNSVELLSDLSNDASGDFSWNNQNISGIETITANNIVLNSIVDAETDTDKFLVLDAENVIDYRTSAEILSDLSGDADDVFDWNSQNLTGINNLEVTGTSELDNTIFTNKNNVVHYRNVLHYSTAGYPSIGTLKITMPKSWSYTMLKVKISGYNYSPTVESWECVIDGYNYTAGTTWLYPHANITGAAPFSSVRLGHDGTYCCLLLGTTATEWRHPKIVITDVVAGFQNSTGWQSGWTGEFITDEGGITVTGTPTPTFTVTGGLKVTGTPNLSTVINAGADVNKFLVLDASNNIDYRNGAEVASDIDGVWTDYSATSTVVGWADGLTKTIYYKLTGKTCIVRFYITGISNSTTTSFTLPVVPSDVFGGSPQSLGHASGQDNTSDLGIVDVFYDSGVFSFSFGIFLASDSWTASGYKTIAGTLVFQTT